jgi:hypothetical protein
VDMFAHNKSGIAYQDGNRRSKTVVNHKREPHQQHVPIEHHLYQVYYYGHALLLQGAQDLKQAVHHSIARLRLLGDAVHAAVHVFQLHAWHPCAQPLTDC